MKRILLALLAGGTMAGAVAGAAATLDVNGGVLQTGVDTDLTCDADGVRLSYAPETDGSITSARINGIDPACLGNKLLITFNDSLSLRASVLLGTVGDSSVAVGSYPATNNQAASLNAGNLSLELPAGTQAATLNSFRMTVHSTPTVNP